MSDLGILYERAIIGPGDGPDWAQELRGRCVVANGCFDVLHPGHLEILSTLAAEAVYRDMLPLVLLNSDRSVRSLKGPTRPFLDEMARASLLTSLQWPLTVLIFDEDSPQLLMNALQPPVVVKGAEYDPETVIRWSGSQVVSVPMLGTWSTTSVLERMGEEGPSRR